MPDSLYEQDALAWSEQQALLLRRLSAGERLNGQVDWANVIEEVQDVGLSELRSCRSLLRQALVHLLKLHAWPQSQADSHWRGEVIGFLKDARDRFSPSMRQKIGLDDLYRAAADQVQAGADDTGEPRMLPEICLLTLDELLAERTDVANLVGKLMNA